MRANTTGSEWVAGLAGTARAGVAMLAVIVLATVGFALASLAGLPVPAPGSVSTLAAFLIGVGITSGSLATVTIVATRVLVRGSNARPPAPWKAVTLATLAAVVGVNGVGTWIMRRLGEAYTGMPEIEGLGDAAAILVVAVVIAPVAEEWFFREIVLVRCFPRGPAPVALAVSAISFGLLHLGSGGPALVGTLAVLGLALGWLRLRTGSLRPPILVHAIQNLVALGLVTAGRWAV